MNCCGAPAPQPPAHYSKELAMGLLDQLAGQVMGSLGGQPAAGAQGNMMSSVMAMIDQAGGVPALLQKLQQSGMLDQVQSWIGTGQNHAISGDQLSAALGQDNMAQLAQQAGVAPEQASAGMAQLLPQLIDQLTPGGAMPDDTMLSQGLQLLKGKFLG
jgi:uncharacterized protein YidB (DUF937 family)